MSAPAEEQAILDRDRLLLVGLVEADVAALDALLDADFVAVHITGQEQTRDDWLQQIASGRMAYHQVERVSAHVEVHGDSAVLVTRNQVLATIWGARGRWPLESTSTYARRDGTWLLRRSTATMF
ncbi:nuclear transport factor 2 family protein [Cellulosimicrobium sp. CUA-896]|uniref:nuclear transport factor 2 family protein n=1 Tax=Cellulosimicrobium sp. CUA-896 TaxID=1517881 RepID=UPI000967213A|nr:nuclear transport factor 2 family protein [Cellulosimicrobium sp. CUA-896]OLT52277.1 hypothetical protein BJF88_13970 [Cellulosimicrobium sp. CUA-896]